MTDKEIDRQHYLKSGNIAKNQRVARYTTDKETDRHHYFKSGNIPKNRGWPDIRQTKRQTGTTILNQAISPKTEGAQIYDRQRDRQAALS